MEDITIYTTHSDDCASHKNGKSTTTETWQCNCHQRVIQILTEKITEREESLLHALKRIAQLQAEKEYLIRGNKGD